MMKGVNVRRQQRGDTIIEVLFATTVFSVIAVGGLSIMNQGASMAQRSLEIGLVRQQIDAQADALRYLNRAYTADFGKRGHATNQWQRIVSEQAVGRSDSFTAMAESGECVMPTESGNPFALDVTKLDGDPILRPSATPATYAKVRYDAAGTSAEGLWIQAVRSPGENVGFYDFHIRACWDSPGQAVPMTMGTIVRLYEPRG